MSTDAIQEPIKGIEERWIEAMQQVTALTQENQRLRMALKEIGDWCDGQNLYVARIARDALNQPIPAMNATSWDAMIAKLK